jgi:hypothetical protein
MDAMFILKNNKLVKSYSIPDYKTKNTYFDLVI